MGGKIVNDGSLDRFIFELGLCRLGAALLIPFVQLGKSFGSVGLDFVSHRAIDDVKALVEVLMEMDIERPDLLMYINLFGFNKKYGISGCKIKGVRYVPQSYHDKKTLVEETLYSYLKAVPSAEV